MVYCRVKTCRHQDKSVCTSHRLPKDEQLCKEWVRRMGNEDLLHKNMKNLHNVRVCSCHFTKDDYNRQKSLLPGAVPTRFCENTQPISDEKMDKFFLTSKRLPTTAALEPLMDISNPKAITRGQPQTTMIVQSVNEIEQPLAHIKQVTSVEDRELRVFPLIEDNESRSSKQTIHHKRKVSESRSETSEDSTGTLMPKKKYRLSAILNGKSMKLDNLYEKLDNGSHLSCAKIAKIVDLNSKSFQNLTQNDKCAEVTNIEIITNKFEQLCKSLKPAQLNELSYKIDLLVNYYCKNESLPS